MYTRLLRTAGAVAARASRKCRTTFRILIAGMIATMSACNSGPKEPSRNTAPTLTELRSAAYTGLVTIDGSITLRDGTWEGAPMVAGGAARPRVTFARDFVITGDVDSIAPPDAVVLLSESGGGTGEFVHMAVMTWGRVPTKRGDRVGASGASGASSATSASSPPGTHPNQLGIVLLGDRVRIRRVRVENQRIIVDMIQAGPADPMCCPGELVTRTFGIVDGELEDIAAPDITGRFDLTTLDNTEWKLRWWSWDEAVETSAPEVTISFAGNQVSGASGCNRFTAGITIGDTPTNVTIAPVAGTRMMCEDIVMETEDRFLSRFGEVRGITFMAGQLGLIYEGDASSGVMLFDRKQVP